MALVVELGGVVEEFLDFFCDRLFVVESDSTQVFELLGQVLDLLAVLFIGFSKSVALLNEVHVVLLDLHVKSLLVLGELLVLNL